MKQHKVINWIEKNLKCSNRVARFAGKPVKLLPWQKKDIKKLFTPKGQRTKVQEYLIDHPRKTGKTEYISYIILYMLYNYSSLHWVHSAPLAIQSNILSKMLFSVVKNSKLPWERMPAAEPYLELPNGNTYTETSGQADSKQGLNIYGFSLDEADKTNLMTYELLEGSCAIQDEPLSILLCNAPEDKTSWLVDKIDYGRKVNSGEIKDKTILANIVETTEAEAEDYQNPKVWHKANPSMPILTKPAFYHKMIKGLKKQPAKLVNFQRLFLGLHNYQSSDNWISPELVQSVPSEAIPKHLDWFAGLDMSTVKDLTSLSLFAEENNKFYIRNYNFIPRRKLIERQDRDTQKVKDFLKGENKNLFVSPDESIEIDWIEKMILAIKERDGLSFRTLGIDRVKHAYFSKQFERKFELLSFSMQPTQFTSPIIFLEENFLKKKIYLADGNPVWLWSLSNVVLGNPLASPVRFFHKSKSREAIDPIVATGLASGVYLKKYNAPTSDNILVFNV